MLQVRANSWHYWVWKLGRDSTSRPKNLCRYFWHCVFKIVGAMVIGGLVLAGLTFIGLTLYTHPVGSAFVVIACLLGAALVVGLGYVVGAWVDRRQERKDAAFAAYVRGEGPHPREKKKKEPGVIRSFLKARKQKYCPLIQVVDE